MNFIEELYYGNIRPSEQYFIKNTPYAKALDTAAKNEEILSEALDDDLKKKLTELMDAQSEILCITALEKFIEGFKLGAALMFDTFLNDKDRVFKDVI